MKTIFLFLRMKNLLRLTCLLSLSILVASCNEDDPPRISLSVSETHLGFEAATLPVQVRTDFAWSARIMPAEAAAWCRLSLENSDRPETVNIYVDANLPQGQTAEERHATIIFKTGGKGSNTSTTLHVTQGIMPEQN